MRKRIYLFRQVNLYILCAMTPLHSYLYSTPTSSIVPQKTSLSIKDIDTDLVAEVVLPDLSEVLKKPEAKNLSQDDSPAKTKQQETFLYELPATTQPTIHEDPPINLTQNQGVDTSKSVLINFNNVNIIEYIRFISRISNKNFSFDENDLQFNVTIVSEEPATIENVMTALLQELRIHELSIIEDGNTLLIHKNPKVNSISRVSADTIQEDMVKNSDLVTQVFRLNTLTPENAAIVLRPLVSDSALVEVLPNTDHLIVTDISSNVEKIAQLLKSLDSPNSGVVIGQYVSRLTNIDILIPLAQQIMDPISLNQTLSFVSHPASNSIFIISSPFLVERTIAILQYLDQNQASTRILNLNDLKMNNLLQGGTAAGSGTGNAERNAGTKTKSNQQPLQTENGQWLQNPDGSWSFKPNTTSSTTKTTPPTGAWQQDDQGNWNFNSGSAATNDENTPKGHWVQDKDGNWTYALDSTEIFTPSTFNRHFEGKSNLSGGVKKVTKFYIYKLRYRQGSTVEPLLRQIADTVQQNEKGNEDLISTLRSVQWLNTPNSLVFSGTIDALDKARALTKELDTPVRQVFIEVLILETTLEDSLQYGVSYGSRFGGGNISGSQSFYAGQTPLTAALNSAGFSGLAGPVGSLVQTVPDATRFGSATPGFNLGVIGQKITHCGTEFGSIGALVNALHDRTKDKVVSNPKLLVEDNSPAEIFVGLNTPYRTQSISNDIGSVITSNYDYRDIGTTLKVTPYLGNGDIVALDIEEEVSTIIAGLITDASSASTSPGPTTRINRTTTRVHIPDTYFLIISGMMQNEESRERTQVPCLGSVPLLGAGFSSKINLDKKRNLMVFIRPKIVDTEEEIQSITKHQQDIYDYGNCLMNYDEYEVTEALDLFNVSKTLHPEDENLDEDSWN